MLIFFIVTSSFIKESGVDVQRPQAQTASPQDKINILIAYHRRRAGVDGQEVVVRAACCAPC